MMSAEDAHREYHAAATRIRREDQIEGSVEGSSYFQHYFPALTLSHLV